MTTTTGDKLMIGIAISCLLGVIFLPGCLDDEKSVDPEREKGAFDYHYWDDGDYHFKQIINRYNKTATIKGIEGRKILFECRNWFIVDDLAKDEFLGMNVTLHMIEIDETSYSKDFGYHDWGMTDHEVESYSINGVFTEYIKSRNELISYWQEITKGLDFTDVHVDFTNAIDKYGAGMHMFYNTTISIMNPTNVSTRFNNQHFGRSVYLRLSVPEQLLKDKFKVTLDGTQIFGLTKYQKTIWHDDGGYSWSEKVWKNEVKSTDYNIILGPGETRTFNLSFEQFGTAPGVYKHGNYKLNLKIIGKSYGICAENTKIDNHIITLKLGNGDD